MKKKRQDITDTFHEELHQIHLRHAHDDGSTPFEEFDQALLELQDRYLLQVSAADDVIGLRRVIAHCRFSFAHDFARPFPEGLQLFTERYALGFEDVFEKSYPVGLFYGYCGNQGRLDVALPYIKEVLDEAEEGRATEPAMYLDLWESFHTLHDKVVKALGSSLHYS